MENFDEVIKFYDAFAESYDTTVLRDQDYIAYDKIPGWLLDHWPGKQKTMSILDLGCGTGLGDLKFFRAGHQVTGIDISPKMVERAQKLPFKQLLCQGLEIPLPFSDRQFDGAILLGVMEFIQNPQALFKEVARILKAEGLFGLTIPKKLPDEKEKELGILTHDPSEIEKVFLDIDFSILQQEDFQGFIYQETTVFYRGYLIRKG